MHMFVTCALYVKHPCTHPLHRHKQLESTLVVAQQFHETLEPLSEWLMATEKRLANSEPIGTQTTKLEEQISQHKVREHPPITILSPQPIMCYGFSLVFRWTSVTYVCSCFCLLMISYCFSSCIDHHLIFSLPLFLFLLFLFAPPPPLSLMFRLPHGYSDP